MDAATSPYPGWDYSPARHTISGDVGAGGHGGGSVDLPAGHGGGGGGGWDLGGLDEGFAVVVAVVLALVAVIVAAAAFWWVLLPLLAVVVDAAIVVILFVAGCVARVAFRRPWTVQARSSRGDRLTRKGRRAASGPPATRRDCLRVVERCAARRTHSVTVAASTRPRVSPSRPPGRTDAGPR